MCSKGPEVKLEPWAAAAGTQPLDILTLQLPSRPLIPNFTLLNLGAYLYKVNKPIPDIKRGPQILTWTVPRLPLGNMTL